MIVRNVVLMNARGECVSPVAVLTPEVVRWVSAVGRRMRALQCGACEEGG